MKIIRAKDYNDMSRKAANIISAQVILKPDSVLGLATGSSPIGIYEQLIKWYHKGDVDFGDCTTFNLDEYRGLTPDHDQSYHYFMHKNFFDAVNVPAERINLPDGAQLDAERECHRYDAAIRAAGGSAAARHGPERSHRLQRAGRVFLQGYALCKSDRVHHRGEQALFRLGR